MAADLPTGADDEPLGATQRITGSLLCSLAQRRVLCTACVAFGVFERIQRGKGVMARGREQCIERLERINAKHPSSGVHAIPTYTVLTK